MNNGEYSSWVMKMKMIQATPLPGKKKALRLLAS